MTSSGSGAGAEIVVVGAGVIGLSVAYELLRRGHRVVVLERHSTASGATSAAAGMLAPASEADVAEAPLIDFALDSLRRYPGFVADLEALAGLSCQYRQEGTLWVALSRDEEADLEHLVALQRAKGLSARRLTSGEVFAREPHLSGRVVSGLSIEGDHQVNPRALARCLHAAVLRLGGAVATGSSVGRINTSDGRVVSVSGTRDGRSFETACSSVVLAAGAWSSVDISAPVPGLAVRPVKGQIVRLQGPALLRHVVRTPEVYLVPRLDGELVVGATMEEQGFDPMPTAGAVMDLLREAWQVLPGIYDLHVAELSVGFRPAVRDGLPVIGAASIGGLFVATAHFRHGVLLAPATGHYLAEHITTGRILPELAPFSPARLTVDRAAEPPGRAPSARGVHVR